MTDAIDAYLDAVERMGRDLKLRLSEGYRIAVSEMDRWMEASQR